MVDSFSAANTRDERERASTVQKRYCRHWHISISEPSTAEWLIDGDDCCARHKGLWINWTRCLCCDGDIDRSESWSCTHWPFKPRLCITLVDVMDGWRKNTWTFLLSLSFLLWFSVWQTFIDWVRWYLHNVNSVQDLVWNWEWRTMHGVNWSEAFITTYSIVKT